MRYLFIIIGLLLPVQVKIMANPFDTRALQAIANFPLVTHQTLVASDGIKLAYYPFLPKIKKQKQIVILYHGGGFYNNKSYQWIGKQLCDIYGIGAYLVDIRGHGNSDGIRGDAPSVQQVLDDIDTLIDFVHTTHSGAAIYLAGHSSGAGLVINYAAQHKNPAVQGLILLAPYLGPASGTIREHTDPNKSFVKKVRTWAYILHGLSGGIFCAHIPAVYFNYPPEQDPRIVESYTTTMSLATTPYNTAALFASLQTPFALYVGSNDEQFIPEQCIAYKDKAVQVREQSYAEIIPGQRHLSILVDAHDLIAKAIQTSPFPKK